MNHLKKNWDKLANIQNWSKQNITKHILLIMLAFEVILALIQLHPPLPDLPLISFGSLYLTIAFTFWMYKLNQKGHIKIPQLLTPLVPNILSIIFYYLSFIYNSNDPTSSFDILFIALIFSMSLSGFTIGVRAIWLFCLLDMSAVLFTHVSFIDIFSGSGVFDNLSELFVLPGFAFIAHLFVSNFKNITDKLSAYQRIEELEERLEGAIHDLQTATTKINELLEKNTDLTVKHQEVNVILNNLTTAFKKRDLSIAKGIIHKSPRMIQDKYSFTLVKDADNEPIWVKCDSNYTVEAGEVVTVLGPLKTDYNQQCKRNIAYIDAIMIEKV